MLVVYATWSLDSNGYPHFTYNKNEQLMYANWTGSTWNNQAVTSYTFTDSFPAQIALDKNNYPHIVYFNAAPDSFIGALMYQAGQMKLGAYKLWTQTTPQEYSILLSILTATHTLAT